jgi:hypothetical protein
MGGKEEQKNAMTKKEKKKKKKKKNVHVSVSAENCFFKKKNLKKKGLAWTR